MSVWYWAWLVGVYLAVLSCFVAIVRIGLSAGWMEGLKQLLVFVGFAVAYWFLESWAGVRAPFYVYPAAFPDMIDLFKGFPSWVVSTTAAAHECARMNEEVSATVPLAGAVITFTLMWTARLLLATGWLASYKPIVVALSVGTAALLLDLYLDPVLAISNDCLNMVVHPGVGFWVWFTDPGFGDAWFRIPLFNFSSWYAAPALLVSLVILIAGALSGLTTATDMLLRGLIVFLLAAIFFSAPGANPPIVQMTLVASLVFLGLYYVIKDWSTYKRDNAFRWEIILPLLFFFVYPIAALLFAGAAPILPLIIVAVVLAAIGIIYTFTPYVKWP